MKVLRFATGFVFLTVSAASVACAQQATACGKKKGEHARREQEVARAHLERSLQETEAARARVERDLEATAEARACIERGLQETEAACAVAAQGLQEAEAACAAVADAKAQKIRHYHLQDAEKLAVEALEACEVAEHVQEALARHHLDVEAVNAPEMKLHLEALAAMAELQDPSEMRVLELDGNARLGSLMASLAQQDGSSQRLRERVRALEERLGIADDQPGRSLEDRVEELERRTMAGEERRVRASKEPGSQGGRVERRRGAVTVPRAQAGARGMPGSPAPEAHGLGGLFGRRAAPTPVPPVETTPMAPPHLDHPFPPAEPPSVPGAPGMPAPERFRIRKHADDASPFAPHSQPGSEGHGLTPDRRREIEEVMQRMRGEMEKLREEMNHLREQLGNDQPMRALRGLGSIDGQGGSGAR